ncbi:MAG: aryl-sulfate sulfotransferase [Planctomycetales bacterium]|nr:aryl-sulfate sulfotransferase [Planctomycetales bacterium]
MFPRLVLFMHQVRFRFCRSGNFRRQHRCRIQPKSVTIWTAWLAFFFLSDATLATAQQRITQDIASEAGLGPENVQAGSSDATKDAPPSSTLVLVAPLVSKYVYLINANAEILHRWDFEITGSNAYLFPDGTLMRSSQEPETSLYDGRGSFGRIQKVDWDGKLLWDFKYADEKQLQHHDFELLPNGNVLFIAWEKLSKEQALSAGRRSEKLTSNELYSEKIVEVRPSGLTGGEEVWVWRLWDHLVQDADPQLPNYAAPKDRPRRVDVNFAMTPRADWIHMNAIDYHPEWDQIIVSARFDDELWVIDHSTTTAEARTGQGGRGGHGGDLLYRMGNPQAYGAGTLDDKLIFGQHDCRWILPGYPGAGDITVFNNGTSPPRTGFSSVEQFHLPVSASGQYTVNPDGSFRSPEVMWSYSRGQEMFSFRISGAERLKSGNTLICSGDQPWILEVAPDKSVVWQTKHRFVGPAEAEGFENGAMFRAPGYTLDYFEPHIQAQLK